MIENASYRTTMNRGNATSIALVILTLTSTTICACDDAAEKTTSPTRFADAALLDANWCLEAQIDIAGLAGTQWDASKIEVDFKSDPIDMSGSKAKVDLASDKPIQIVASSEMMTNSVEAQADETITKGTFCKLKSYDGINRGLDANLPGPEGTCRQMNERALAWSLEQLTSEEKARYESEGKQLVMEDDILGLTGPAWYATNSQLNAAGDTVTLQASALYVVYDEHPDAVEETRGVHYCKLTPPSQMLFWLLHRAFWSDPLGTGPNDDEDAAFINDEGCQILEVDSPGSCIFYFAQSQQHYCEEYSGADWNAADAEAKCNQRGEGVYSSAICADREAETSQLDGDGSYKGICVINCGTTGENRWHVYSETAVELTIEEGCADWFPVGA